MSVFSIKQELYNDAFTYSHKEALLQSVSLPAERQSRVKVHFVALLNPRVHEPGARPRTQERQYDGGKKPDTSSPDVKKKKQNKKKRKQKNDDVQLYFS